MSDSYEEYIREKPQKHNLMLNGSLIVGYGKTKEEATQDAMRQAALSEAKLPGGSGKYAVPKPGKKPKPMWFKLLPHRHILWHTAIKYLIDELGIEKVCAAFDVLDETVIGWKKRKSTPIDDQKKIVCKLMVEHLTGSHLERCNLQVGE